MWGNTGFGGHMGGGGGGYSTSPSFGQSQTTPVKAQSRKTQNFVPISIADIYNSLRHDDSVKIGETEAGIISVVGLIRKVDLQSTLHVYEIDDMSGPCLLVKKWMEDSDDSDEPPPRPLMENTYARVNGVPRKVQGQPFLVAVYLKPITDLNELTMHLLEVVHTKLLLKKGFQANDSTSGIQQQIGGGNMEVDRKDHSGGSSDASNALLKSLTKPQALVLQLVNACPEPQGYHIKYIMDTLRLSPAEVRGALFFLCNEGHAYTTSDDETFKGTGGC